MPETIDALMIALEAYVQVVSHPPKITGPVITFTEADYAAIEARYAAPVIDKARRELRAALAAALEKHDG
jgi:hypothetical protein